MQLSKPDDHEELMRHTEKVQMEMQELRCIMTLIDTNGSGSLSVDEFVEAMRNERVEQKMRSMGIDVKMPELYFRTLALVSKSEEVSIDDFVTHLIQMKGQATSVDVQSLTLETAVLKKVVGQLQDGQRQMLEC